MPRSAGDFEASIRKLGFKPEDIRLLLITHAHIDHAGTVVHFKKLTGATVAVMDRDSGKSYNNFLGNSWLKSG